MKSKEFIYYLSARIWSRETEESEDCPKSQAESSGALRFKRNLDRLSGWNFFFF